MIKSYLPEHWRSQAHCYIQQKEMKSCDKQTNTIKNTLVIPPETITEQSTKKKSAMLELDAEKLFFFVNPQSSRVIVMTVWLPVKMCTWDR